MTIVDAIDRVPKQERSRRTLEGILSSAMKLLEQRGYQDFTLQDVCAGAGLSIGAIYSRFSSKDELLRTMQSRLIETIDGEVDRIVGDFANWDAPFEQLVPALVREFASLFRRHDAILRPMMARAAMDPVMARAGQELDARMASKFRGILLKHRNAITLRDPEHAVDTCFEVVFAAVTRFLGLGVAPNVRGKGSWQSFSEDLGMMASAFLTYDQGATLKSPESPARRKEQSETRNGSQRKRP